MAAMQEVTFRTTTIPFGARLALADGERVVGAAQVDEGFHLLIEQVVAEASDGLDQRALAAWVSGLDGETLDRRVESMLNDPDYQGEGYGELYLRALREAAGVD